MAFGPGPTHLTLNGPDPKGVSPIRLTIVSIEDKSFENLTPPKIRAGFVQLAYQPNDFYRAALSTYRAVYVGDVRTLNLESPEIEPICFQGTFATPSFSLDGQKLITLSGDAWPFFDSIQLWDVNLRGTAIPDPNFEPQGEAAPPWLWEMARSVSGGIGPTGGEHRGFATAGQVWQKFHNEKNSSTYEAVWLHVLGGQFESRNK